MCVLLPAAPLIEVTLTCRVTVSYQYATATFKVLNAYAGWSNVNFVLNNVKNPVRTLKIAGPLGLGICAVLYLLANIAYFSAASKEQILKSGVTVASLFFGNVFGRQAQKALTVFVALRYAACFSDCTFPILTISAVLWGELFSFGLCSFRC